MDRSLPAARWFLHVLFYLLLTGLQEAKINCFYSQTEVWGGFLFLFFKVNLFK